MTHRARLFLAILVLHLGFISLAHAADPWKPADGPLKTRWAKDVLPTNALPEYPRPQMVRKDWQNLNGVWQFQSAQPGEEPPFGKDLKEQILVPYPVESALSGVMRHEPRMWYRRTFEVPADWKGRHVLLHFDAVDWEATVYLNGKKLAAHKGGYDAFGFDITGFLKEGAPQELLVGVFDPTNGHDKADPEAGNQPRGKQVLKPGGIMYTPTSGIWQTVWMEPVNPAFIEGIHIVPDVDGQKVQITVDAQNAGHGATVTADAKFDANENGKAVSFSASASGPAGKPITLNVSDPQLWSPDHPALYSLHVKLTSKGKVSDEVESYFAMRKISLGKDEQGITRMLLNNKFVFQVGPLDQGFWPDGIYTAPTDAALKFDIEAEKKLGFNMVRKHVKVEPDRWYYWADKLGLLVWQDMPAGDNQTPESRTQFEHELDRMIAGRGNHPSIVMWVVFNEGWGEKQYDVAGAVEHVRKLDPSRLIDNASGWTDQHVGDVIDMHHYPDPAMPQPEEHRAAVLGEFGGLGLPIEGHMWRKTDKNWGYRKIADPAQLTAAYTKMLSRAWNLRDKGLSAVVYTQTTDVETESNGLLTYDREVFKVDPDQAAAAARGEIQEHVKVLAATSQDQPQTWRYTLAAPADDWSKPDFNDSAWKEGQGGFGTEKTPGAVIHTKWDTHEIWLRRHFTLDAGDHSKAELLVHHDDDAEIYLNGVLALKQPGYLSDYQEFPLSPEARQALKAGDNVIAVHCHQNSGGQFIDAGLVEVTIEIKPRK
ncbi:MAG TPA: glycoside hydrolase family 2 TIM barrel-domain containing protein [Tepidisphaeraceae bacterium]|nr:glycoside hydrolase family 2 TIM barrel-domain containing protein [Tepidisphaeraceae bacterium]